MRPRFLADLLLLSATLVWGMNFPIMKGVYDHIHPLAFTMLRFITAMAALWIVLKLLGYSLEIEHKDILAIAALGLLINTFYQIIFNLGLARTRAGNAGLLMSSTPVFAYLTGVLLGREKFRRRVLGGILLSMSGVVVVVLFSAASVDFSSSRLGDALVLLSAVCWGFYTGGSARLTLKYGAVRMTFWTMFSGTLGLLPLLFSYVVRQDWQAVPPGAWLGFAYSTFLSIVFAYLAWAFALNQLGVSRTAIYTNITPLVALFGGWLLLGEQPTWAQMAGVALILGGVLLVRTRAPAFDVLRSTLRSR